jgi:4,5-DOPA dioxygenase extradiol
MTSNKQPSLFISHGTMYEAFKSEQLKQDFAAIRKQHITVAPSVIVIFSGHWQTQNIAVTTASVMHQMDEGFPAEFTSAYTTKGNPVLATKIIGLLNANGIEASADNYRMLDHGALIPLLLLFPEAGIPVIQISQQYKLDPAYHKKIATILAPLRNENVLFISSGGLVHNRNEIVKMSGQSIAPSDWANEFDDFISTQLTAKSNISNADKMIDSYNHKHFNIAHPTAEHFLPVIFASAIAQKATKIYEAFQWKNLSMSAFKFD